MKTAYLIAALTCSAVLSLNASSSAFSASSQDKTSTNAAFAVAHAGQEHSPQGETPMQAGEHQHGMIEIPIGQPVPVVNLVAHPDAHHGWNLEMQVTNFQLAPEHVNQASSSTEGHAHLYIDGEKITRLYGNWYYLDSLAPGKHEITVSLTANGHETLMHNGQPIQSTVAVDVPAPTAR